MPAPATLASIDEALTTAWASYQNRALKGDDSANRVLDYCDQLLEQRLLLAPAATDQA